MWSIHADVDDGALEGATFQGWTEEGVNVHVAGPGEQCSAPDLYLHKCAECGHEWTDEEEGADECAEVGCWCEEIDSEETEGTGPLSWLNSAGIHIDDDEARVTLSVGDPRGAFCFTMRRAGDGTLLLHTPHPGEGLPHMGLKPLHDGTYEVSSYNPGQKPPLRMAGELLRCLDECVPDLEHYESTHGPGPDRRLAELKVALADYRQAVGS